MVVVRWWFSIWQPVCVHEFVPAIVHVHLRVIDSMNSWNWTTTTMMMTMIAVDREIVDTNCRLQSVRLCSTSFVDLKIYCNNAKRYFASRYRWIWKTTAQLSKSFMIIVHSDCWQLYTFYKNYGYREWTKKPTCHRSSWICVWIIPVVSSLISLYS